MSSIFSPGSRRYTAMRKAISFARGLRRLRPLVEVAAEGIRGDYSLDLPMEQIYTHKLLSDCSTEELCSLLREGIPERHQPQLARGLCERKNGDGPWLREEVCKLIEEGHIRSEIAQAILLRVFFREGERSQTERLISSEHTCSWGKTMLRAGRD